MLILEIYRLWLVWAFSAFRKKINLSLVIYFMYQLQVCHSTCQRVYMLYHTCFCSSGSQHNLLPRSCLEYNVITSIVDYEPREVPPSS